MPLTVRWLDGADGKITHESAVGIVGTSTSAHVTDLVGCWGFPQ